MVLTVFPKDSAKKKLVILLVGKISNLTIINIFDNKKCTISASECLSKKNNLKKMETTHVGTNQQSQGAPLSVPFLLISEAAVKKRTKLRRGGCAAFCFFSILLGVSGFDPVSGLGTGWRPQGSI